MKRGATELNVAYCAYRPWALSPVPAIRNHSKVTNLTVIESKQEFDAQRDALMQTAHVAIFVGWSWIIPASFYNHVLCVGMHPSDLPLYKGGSPLQYQILDNLTNSMASLFTITGELDAGPVWGKEPFSLAGDNMDVISKSLADATENALVKFLDQYPDVTATPQVANNEPTLKRRKPEQSQISWSDLQNKSALELYNFIRGLTDPYPNAFLQDDNGDRLFLTGVHFEKTNGSSPNPTPAGPQ